MGGGINIATCVTGNGGIPHRDRMRTDQDRHPGLVGPRMAISGLGNMKYPTRLADGDLLPDHDDWDCCEDLEEAGLLKTKGSGINPVYGLTDLGWEVLKHLTDHKNSGGSFGTFHAQQMLVLTKEKDNATAHAGSAQA